jgi:hypothetical protein
MIHRRETSIPYGILPIQGEKCRTTASRLSNSLTVASEAEVLRGRGCGGVMNASPKPPPLDLRDVARTVT